MSFREPLNQCRVRELFDYDKTSGQLTWKVATSRRIKAGRVVSAIHKEGYTVVGIDGRAWLAHHVVWLWCHGEMPKGDIDHINRVRNDNRIDNLRCVSRTENLLNAEYKNDMGFPGVRKVPSGRFAVAIHIKRVRKYIGTYDTIEEAKAVYSTNHVALYGLMSRFHPEHPNTLVTEN